MNRKTNQNTRKHTQLHSHTTQHILYTLFVTNRTKPNNKRKQLEREKNGGKNLYEIKRVFIPQRLDAKSHRKTPPLLLNNSNNNKSTQHTHSHLVK